MSDNKERDAKIAAAREAGEKLESIAKEYGLTKARILQITGKSTSRKRHITAGNILGSIARFFAEEGTWPSLRNVADASGVSVSYSKMLVKELASQGKVKVKTKRGRTYIAGVQPPQDLPDDLREKALAHLEEQKKEWEK